jgi:hypothetical protein
MQNHRPQLRRSPQASISSQTVQRLFRAGRRKARLLLATRTYASLAHMHPFERAPHPASTAACS